MSLRSGLPPESSSPIEYNFLQELLAKAAAYRADGGIPDVQSFARWLSDEVSTDSQNLPSLSPGETIESASSKYIIFLYRYAKGYGRKLLKDTPLSSIDDVPYLLMLFFAGPASKMELIEKNVQEKTTGMEILNRLIRLGLVEQFSNPDDKRSRKLSISEQGKALVLGLMKGMDTLTEIVSGNLTQQERVNLFFILDKLNGFHAQINQDGKERGLDEIKALFIP